MSELRCGGCGAALPPEATQRAVSCTFCGVTSSPPPRVVERVVERIVVATPTASEGGSLRCPRCAEALHAARTGPVVLQGCRTCGGVFLDREALAQLPRFDREASDLARRMVGLGRMMGMQLPSKNAVVGCPVCAGPMRRETVRFTDVAVDVCDPHGTWFDWDELKTFAKPPTEDPTLALSNEELEAAGVPGAPEDGFFTNLKRLFFGD